MRAPASTYQRKTGKIVPGFSARMFLAARIEPAASVSRWIEQHHHGLCSPYRSETGRRRLQSCRRWRQAFGQDVGLLPWPG